MNKDYTKSLPKTDIKGIVLSLNESSQTVAAIQRNEKVGHIVSTILVYVILGFLAILMIFPFYWMIITSLKQYAEIMQDQQTLFPSIVMWSNYVYVFNEFKFG